MESTESSKERAKKVWSIVRISFLMMGRSISISQSKLIHRTKMATKTIATLISNHHHHYSALTCRSNDIHTSHRRHYEFSCSNTPVHRRRRPSSRSPSKHPEMMMNGLKQEKEYLKCSSPQVDMDAEEFIKRFYRDLMEQKRIAAMESPSPYHTWAVK